VLPNGLTLLVAERRSLPLVTMRLVLRAGSSHDPSQLAGLAAFTARLLRHGAGPRDAEAFAGDLDSLGGHFGASIGLDQLTVDGEFTTKTLDEGLELYLDAVLRPRFDAGEVESERQRAIAEIVQSRDDPEHVADVALQHHLFGAHPYAHSPGGTVRSLERVLRDDLVRHHAEALRPDGGVLVVVGDVSPPEMAARLADAFSAWPSQGGPPALVPPTARTGGGRVVLVKDPGAGQVQLRFGNVGVPRATPHYHALAVSNVIFGGGFTSRLVREARVKRGLTYNISSRFQMGMRAGPFTISTFTRNEKLAEMHEVVTGELGRLRGGGITDEEIDSARAYVLGLQVRRVETPEALAGAIAETEIFGLGLEALTGFRDAIERVGAADCAAAVAEAYPDPAELLTIMVGDEARIREDAARLGELTVVGPDFAE
jgi:zinc protease